VLILAAVKLYHALLKEYGQRYEPIRPSLGILNWLGKALIILIGLLIAMDSLKISITPLLTTLGIGGLAVALAFKDTLANFFAGLYILADRPIRLGDYIKLEGGPEGYVESIGWRSTRMRTLFNNIVVIPNSKVSESIITNYFLPERRVSLVLNIGVSYDSGSRKVEASRRRSDPGRYRGGGSSVGPCSRGPVYSGFWRLRPKFYPHLPRAGVWGSILCPARATPPHLRTV